MTSSIFFLVSEKGKYFIDFKNGDGTVGEGDPQNKPGELIIKLDRFH